MWEVKPKRPCTHYVKQINCRLLHWQVSPVSKKLLIAAIDFVNPAPLMWDFEHEPRKRRIAGEICNPLFHTCRMRQTTEGRHGGHWSATSGGVCGNAGCGDRAAMRDCFARSGALDSAGGAASRRRTRSAACCARYCVANLGHLCANIIRQDFGKRSQSFLSMPRIWM